MTFHIKEQGVYTSRGTAIKAERTFDLVHGELSPEGQICYCDHGSIFYQIPENNNGKKVMFVHGYGSSKASCSSPLEKSGKALLVTHSQGSILSWFIASTPDNISAVVALEPGTFVMP